MALGYETTGTGPNIIANAGNAMAADIRRIGEQIRGDIIKHNTDKQVAGLLQEVQAISPDSPTFQNDLVGVLAKYPMAASDPRAKMGLQMLGTAWQQKQDQKDALTRFGQQKELVGMRTGGANRPYGGSGELGAAPDLGGAEEQARNDIMGAGSRMMGSLGGGGGPLGGVPFTPPPSDLPVSGGVVGEENALFNTDLDRTFKRIGVDERTGKRYMAQDAAMKAREMRKPASRPTTQKISGVGLVQWNPDERAWDTVVEEGKKGGRWVNTGTHWENVESGAQIPIGASEIQDRGMDLRENAAKEKTTNRSTDEAVKILNSKISSLKTSIDKRQNKKDQTPEEQKELGEWQQQHVDAVRERDVLSGNKVLVIKKTNGERGFLPKEEVQKAIDSGEYVLP